MGSEVPKVQFLKDTSKADVGEILPDTFLIFKGGYSFPESLKGVEYLEFKEFKGTYFNLHANKFIFFGLNKFMTPQNRCEMVFDFMQSMTRQTEKMSIDTLPFLGEPWRLWYHFDITNQDPLGMPHGYAVETEWKHWFLRDSDSWRLSGSEIERRLNTRCRSDIESLTTKFSLEDIENNAVQEWYEEALDHVCEKHGTDKMILNNLLKLCNEKFSKSLSVNSYLTNEKIILPNLGIYRFFVEENKRRQDIYNAIARIK